MIGVGLARLGAVDLMPASVAGCPPATQTFVALADQMMRAGRREDAVVQYALALEQCPDPWIMAKLQAAVKPSVGLGTALVVGGSLLVIGFVLGKVV